MQREREVQRKKRINMQCRKEGKQRPACFYGLHVNTSMWRWMAHSGFALDPFPIYQVLFSGYSFIHTKLCFFSALGLQHCLYKPMLVNAALK